MASSTDTVGIRLILRGQQAVQSGFRNTRSGVRQLREELRTTGEQASKMGAHLRDVAGIAIRAGAAVGIAGAGIVGTLAAIGVKTAATNEQAEIAFTNMLGSATGAKTYLEELKVFAAQTPFELPDVQMGAQRLMAMGVSARNVLPYLTAIGDAVSGMGGGAEEINQVVTAIGQIQAKGKVQGDEILQLTEAGIPALRILAAQYGVTTSAMSKMMEQGKVSSDDALPKLIEGIEKGTKATKGFGGMMEQQSRTLAGRWSTIKDVATQGLAGAVEPLLPILGRTMQWVGEKLPDGMSRAESAGRKVAAVLNVMRPLFRDMWTAAKDLGRAFMDGFGDSGLTLNDLRRGVRDVAAQLRPDSDFMQGMRMVAGAAGFAAGKILRMQARGQGLVATMKTAGAVLTSWRDTAVGAMLAVARVSSEVRARTTGGIRGLLLGGGSTNTGSLSEQMDRTAAFNAPGGIAGSRAMGGNVSAGKVYRINERGMEYFQPNTGGRILPTRPDVSGMLAAGDGVTHVVLELDGEAVATTTVRATRRMAARRG